ncbi:MAG: nucleotidyltransferase family protein [Candidatus Latescibacterota bacterium]|nr:nucleotidyltransferase family protein [Candidatus Latescibacterota bacterium]MEE3040952.1 nucleotidyltransferase family protein [Candidatus Latescibacterota bacterium]
MTISTQSVEAVVLAAGRSSRMGRPKQLLPLPGGNAVIERVVGNVAPFVSDVVVVVGHVPGQVAAMAERAGARIAINPQVDRGMLSSVQAGIAALHEATTGILLCLGDQPEVDERTIVPVLDAATETSLVIPTFEGKGGHPVYIAQTFFEEIRSLAFDAPEGLRSVVRGHPQDTTQVELTRPDLLHDMDTRADYQQTWQRLKQERQTSHDR